MSGRDANQPAKATLGGGATQHPATKATVGGERCWTCLQVRDWVGTLQQERDELRAVLDCKGSFNGTVSERGGEPAICTKCEGAARRALAATGGDTA